MASSLSFRIPVVVATLLLILMGILAGGAALRESITVDEVAHIGAGVSYLQKLDLRMNIEHPPLAKVLAGLPLILRGVHADYSDFSWPFSNRGFGNILGEWAWGHALALRWNNPRSTVLWARVPMLLLTLILGAFVYRFASELGGSWGGLLCLAAYVTTPTFLVFGPLVLTDVPITFVSLLTLWSFASLWRAPSRRGAIVFGLLLGASFLTKFSSGLLLICFLVFRLSLRVVPLAEIPKDREELRSWRRLRGRCLWKGIFIAAMTSYVIYFILSWGQPADSLEFLGRGSAALLLRRLLMPPWLYFRGLFFFAVTSSRPTFLLGHVYSHGVWFFFPIIFLLKSTLAFLLMLLLAMPLALVARRKQGNTPLVPANMQFHWRAAWVFLLVISGCSLLSRMTISIRHFTIPIVLMILLLALLPRAIARLSENGWRPARPAALAYMLLSLFSLLTVARAYPNYFPFLNSLSFGHPGYALVSDSNLDWNHALPEVKNYVEQHGLTDALIDEYGFNDPAVYVPHARFWNCQQPQPSDAGHWAFVSGDMIEDAHNCVWLLQLPHEALAGGSMYAFRLPEAIPAAGTPGGPPAESELHSFGAPMPGYSDARLIFLNCIRDSKQLQPTMDNMIAQYQAAQAKRAAQRGHL
ncbi:MAG TPA: glycosyltransferase family 39 protein [Candidatus Acidoferrum sp.]|nr:glycosyltransferase family 39 protein [Candidatus Acidoferrum sp.]